MSDSGSAWSVTGPKGEFVFPKNGIMIPAQFKEAFKKYDANGDDVLDEKKFNALPPAIKNVVTEYVKRTTP